MKAKVVQQIFHMRVQTKRQQLCSFLSSKIQTTNNYPLLRLIVIVVMKERSILLL